MITGEYIIDYIAYDKKGFECDNGNIAISDGCFDSASDFSSFVSSVVKENAIMADRVRIVGVFKL